MQIRTEIDATAVRELGRMLSSATMDLYNVQVHTLRPKAPARHPARPKGQEHPEQRPRTGVRHAYTVTCLTKSKKFTGANASRDALAFILGLLEGKRGLSSAQRKRVQFWSEAVRDELRRESGHYADHAFYTLSGRNRMIL